MALKNHSETLKSCLKILFANIQSIPSHSIDFPLKSNNKKFPSLQEDLKMEKCDSINSHQRQRLHLTK